MKQIRCLFYLMILIIVSSACTKQSQAGVAVINSPCSIPCWQNITPGLTKADDLGELLRNVPDINEREILKLPAWDNFDESYRFTFKDQKVEGEAYIKNDLVNNIGLYGDLSIPIDQIIQQNGNPNKLIVSSTFIPGLFGGDGIALDIYLVYIEKGVAFSFLNKDLDLITIKSDTRIEKVIYAEPDTIVKYVTPDRRSLEKLEQQGRVFDWNGYQEIPFNPKQ